LATNLTTKDMQAHSLRNRPHKDQRGASTLKGVRKLHGLVNVDGRAFGEHVVALLESEVRHAGEKARKLVSELEERGVLVHLNVEHVSKGRAEAHDAAVATVHDLGGLGGLGLHGGEDAGCRVVLTCGKFGGCVYE